MAATIPYAGSRKCVQAHGIVGLCTCQVRASSTPLLMMLLVIPCVRGIECLDFVVSLDAIKVWVSSITSCRIRSVFLWASTIQRSFCNAVHLPRLHPVINRCMCLPTSGVSAECRPRDRKWLQNSHLRRNSPRCPQRIGRGELIMRVSTVFALVMPSAIRKIQNCLTQ